MSCKLTVSGGVSGLEEGLDRLHMSGAHRHQESELESEEIDSLRSEGELPSAFQAYLKGIVSRSTFTHSALTAV